MKRAALFGLITLISLGTARADTPATTLFTCKIG